MSNSSPELPEGFSNTNEYPKRRASQGEARGRGRSLERRKPTGVGPKTARTSKSVDFDGINIIIGPKTRSQSKASSYPRGILVTPSKEPDVSLVSEQTSNEAQFEDVQIDTSREAAFFTSQVHQAPERTPTRNLGEFSGAISEESTHSTPIQSASDPNINPHNIPPNSPPVVANDILNNRFVDIFTSHGTSSPARYTNTQTTTTASGESSTSLLNRRSKLNTPVNMAQQLADQLTQLRSDTSARVRICIDRNEQVTGQIQTIRTELAQIGQIANQARTEGTQNHQAIELTRQTAEQARQEQQALTEENNNFRQQIETLTRSNQQLTGRLDNLDLVVAQLRNQLNQQQNQQQNQHQNDHQSNRHEHQEQNQPGNESMDHDYDRRLGPDEILERRRQWEMADRTALNNQRYQSYDAKITALPLSDGEPQQLASLVRLVDALIQMARNEPEVQYIVDQVKVKLATTEEFSKQEIVQARNWFEMKGLLQKELARFDTLPAIDAEMRGLNQKTTESVVEYGKRATTLFKKYQNHYGLDFSAQFKLKVQSEIVEYFIVGLQNHKVHDAIRISVADRDLTEVIDYAIRQETLVKRDEPDFEALCLYCRKTGHKQINCTSKKRDIAKSNALPGSAPDKTCETCGILGHAKANCFVKYQKEAKVNNTNVTGNKNGSNGNGSQTKNNNGQNNKGQNDNNGGRNGGFRGGYRGKRYRQDYNNQQNNNQQGNNQQANNQQANNQQGNNNGGNMNRSGYSNNQQYNNTGNQSNRNFNNQSNPQPSGSQPHNGNQQGGTSTPNPGGRQQRFSYNNTGAETDQSQASDQEN